MIDMTPPINDPHRPTIGIEEAAEILRCGYTVVQKLIATGELPALFPKRNAGWRAADEGTISLLGAIFP